MCKQLPKVETQESFSMAMSGFQRKLCSTIMRIASKRWEQDILKLHLNTHAEVTTSTDKKRVEKWADGEQIFLDVGLD